MRKSGFIMLLTVALLLSIQFAAFGVEPTKDAFCTDSVISESKIIVQEEVTEIPIVSENMTAFAVEPIQDKAVFYNYLTAVDYSYCVIPYNFSGSAINKISAMPGGGLLYAGFL